MRHSSNPWFSAGFTTPLNLSFTVIIIHWLIAPLRRRFGFRDLRVAMAGPTLTYEEFAQREQKAENCGASDFEQNQLALDQVDATGRSIHGNSEYRSVREAVAQCYNGVGKGLDADADKPFLEKWIGRAKEAFSEAASGVGDALTSAKPQLSRDLNDALERSGTEDSNVNRVWKQREQAAGLSGPGG